MDHIVKNHSNERAKEVQKNIQDLFDGRLGKKKPRGKPRAGCTWSLTLGRCGSTRNDVSTPPPMPREHTRVHWKNRNVLPPSVLARLGAFSTRTMTSTSRFPTMINQRKNALPLLLFHMESLRFDPGRQSSRIRKKISISIRKSCYS